MKLKTLTPSLLDKTKSHLVAFLKAHGDQRITKKGLHWLHQLEPDQLYNDGTEILVAFENNKIYGLLAIADYGLEESYIAVHQEKRQKRLAENMMDYLMEKTGKLYGRVALDNIPSLKTCFSLGMVGFKVVTGPTGKPTLWLGGGNWSKEELESKVTQ